MNYLDHEHRTILQDMVEDLGLDSKATGARPFCVLRLELTKELGAGAPRGDWMEVGRVRVDGRRCAG